MAPRRGTTTTATSELSTVFSPNYPNVDTDSSSKMSFFSGLSPVRANSPISNDPLFSKKTPSFSLGSSFIKMGAGRVEVGSPSCGASSTKVRILVITKANSLVREHVIHSSLVSIPDPDKVDSGGLDVGVTLAVRVGGGA